jgi:Glutathione S-transferase, N-terminal domain
VRSDVYRVHGMMKSYFTRKMTGYLDYKRIPWVLRRFPGMSPAAMAAGYPGGMPAVETPAGEFMWDSTAMIHHLDGAPRDLSRSGCPDSDSGAFLRPTGPAFVEVPRGEAEPVGLDADRRMIARAGSQ